MKTPHAAAPPVHALPAVGEKMRHVVGLPPPDLLGKAVLDSFGGSDAK